MRLKSFLCSSVLVTCFTIGIMPNALAHNDNHRDYGADHRPHYQNYGNSHRQHHKANKYLKHHRKHHDRHAYREHHHNRNCDHNVVVYKDHRPQWRINIDYSNIGVAWRSSYSY